jgi:hypothetical protein
MSLITKYNFQIIPILHDQVYDFGGIKVFWINKNVIFEKIHVFLFYFK